MTNSEPPARLPMILVAEDDPGHRFILQRIFASIGVEAELRFVGNGRAMLDYLAAARAAPSPENPWPHFALLDLHMPGLGGIDTLREMRADRAMGMLPVIAFSSSEQQHHIDDAYAVGANAYLVKVGDFKALMRDLSGMFGFWLRAARVPLPPASAPAVDGDARR